MTARGSVHGRPRPSGRRRGRNVGSSTAHWTSVRSMPSSTTAILPMFQAATRRGICQLHPVDAARLSGQLFSEVRAAKRPCAKYQQ
jgi:hypothetical protein